MKQLDKREKFQPSPEEREFLTIEKGADMLMLSMPLDSSVGEWGEYASPLGMWCISSCPMSDALNSKWWSQKRTASVRIRRWKGHTGKPAQPCRCFLDLPIRRGSPSYFVSAAFAGVMSVIVYLAVWRLRRRGGGRLVDGWLLLCVGLQLLLYVVSVFMQDYTRFNLYFAVDITLTLSFAALLPLALREVAGK